MSKTMQQKCLVLNKSWTPIGTVSLKRAIIMLWSDDNGIPKARIIDHESYAPMTWDDWAKLQLVATDEVIRASNAHFRVPKVILLSSYDKMPQPKMHFSRRSLFKRDKMTCQYCGKRFVTDDLTVDHVIPKSQGGRSVWENCVTSCVDCNARKAARTPEQAKMPLLKIPKKPRIELIRYHTLKPVKSWEAFLGEAYWNVSIEDK